jgi:hypothetical protein
VRGEGGNGYRLMEVGDPVVVTQAARWVGGGGGKRGGRGRQGRDEEYVVVGNRNRGMWQWVAVATQAARWVGCWGEWGAEVENMQARVR